MMKTLIKTLINFTIIVFIFLLIVSYMEILIKNVNVNPIYSGWNIIVNVCNI